MRLLQAPRVLVPALALLAASCGGDASEPIDLSPVEAQLRTLASSAGVTSPGDATAVSTALFDLGQALFFDKELSGNRDVACSTCHLADFGTADGRTLPLGVGGTGTGPTRVGATMIPRNAPAAFNAHHFTGLFWDSRVEMRPGNVLFTPAGAQLTPAMEAIFLPGLEVLAAQSMFPPTSRGEMRGNLGENEIADEADGDFTAIWGRISDRLKAIPAYVTMFQAAYPGLMAADINMAHVGNAIAAFESTAFDRYDSPFERMLTGASGEMTHVELLGGIEFFGVAGCAACHNGPVFSDDRFHNIGMPQFGPGKGDGLGTDDDFGRERVSGNTAQRYRFRTPPLLNVELTGPYGHLGQFSTLRSMVEHYRNPATSLNTYDIMTHVTEPGIVGTQVGNQSDVLAGLSGLVAGPRNFDVDRVTAFLRTLTADSARDLSDIVPTAVPSGLSID